MTLVGKTGALVLTMACCGCAGVPSGVTAVDGFELDRYLGIWYEIARLDHRFERGLNNVTATYARGEDGAVRVLNRGYRKETGVWSEAEGTAYFVNGLDRGQFKVTFFWPFYGGYNIISCGDASRPARNSADPADASPQLIRSGALDKEPYSYALVCSNTRSYLWILAREPQLDEAILKRLLETARELEFPVDDLIYVDQNPVPNTER